jgi:Gas vesicle protein K
MKQASASAELQADPSTATQTHHDGATSTPVRIGFDADDAGAGLGQLVVAILEIVRQLLERQAIRRVEAGSLTDDEIERLGSALLALENRFAQLHDTFRARQGASGVPDRSRQETHSTGPDSGQNGERP